MRRVSLPFKLDGKFYSAVKDATVTAKFPMWPTVTLTYFDGNPDVTGDEVVVVAVSGGFEEMGAAISRDLERGVAWSIFLPARVMEHAQVTGGEVNQQGGEVEVIPAKSGKRNLGVRDLNRVPVDEALKAQADATAFDIAAHFVEVLDRKSSPGIKVAIEDMVEAISVLTENNPLLAMRWETLKDRLAIAQYAMVHPDLVALVFQSLVDLSGGDEGNQAFVDFITDLRYGKAHTWSQIMNRINAIPQVRIPRGGLVDLTYRGLFTQPSMTQHETDEKGFTNVPASVLLAGPGLKAIRGRLEYYLSEGFQDALAEVNQAAQARQEAAFRVMAERIKVEEAGLIKIADHLKVVERQVKRQVVAGMKHVGDAMTLTLLADLVGMDVPEEDIVKLIGTEAIQKAMKEANFKSSSTAKAMGSVAS